MCVCVCAVCVHTASIHKIKTGSVVLCVTRRCRCCTHGGDTVFTHTVDVMMLMMMMYDDVLNVEC